jgi:hypothetical protein
MKGTEAIEAQYDEPGKKRSQHAGSGSLLVDSIFAIQNLKR